jgi:hypothetical protein
MTTVYGQLGLNLPKDATEAAEIVAEERNDASSYIQLVQFATLAGQKRKADLAGEKAIELASEDERDTVKQLIEQAKGAGAPGGQGGAQPQPTPGGG